MERDTRGDMRERVERPVEAIPVKRDSPEVVQETHLEVPRDRVRWGPIWAGLIVTLSTFLLLELLAFSLGWLTVDFNLEGGDPPGTGGSAWVTFIIALMAFFAGGVVTALTSSIRGAAAGALNGLMVWALATSLILALSMLGTGLLFGSVGGTVARIAFLTQNQPASLNINPARFLDELRNGAFWGFLTLLATAIAAAVGGWLGDKASPIGHLPHDDSTS